ncbi:hypothetical protein I350_06993 [Cryptococcus amylolentus CBS 6273]|uniref:Transmembrane protein n=1 Tax=Cryptococcus amylolentus CBS 6273 TaxID=1296118 RepID=A0A1E3JJR2_9TREE|nr:hypothetical protein I350_06993 [Cryptococcus amylolentus CBS 6273]
MKLQLALLAALVASVSAEPIRLITWTENQAVDTKFDISQPEELPSWNEAAVDQEAPVAPMVGGKPCHGKSSESGPLSSLLSRLGFTSIPDSAISRTEHEQLDRAHHEQSLDVQRESLLAALRSRLSGYVPFLEGGSRIPAPYAEAEAGEWKIAQNDRTPEIKWWRRAKNGRWEVKEGAGEWRVSAKGERPPKFSGVGVPAEKSMHGGSRHGWKHNHKGFSFVRLRKASEHLSPLESAALAIVLGAGIGSLFHLLVISFVLFSRRFGFCLGPRFGRFGRHCSGKSEERRARRAARKAERKANKEAKAARKTEGTVRLEGEDRLGELEELPAYQDAEQAPLLDEKVDSQV